MRRNTSITTLVIMLIGATVLSGCFNGEEIPPKPQELDGEMVVRPTMPPEYIINNTVTKYTSTSSQYLIKGEPVRYTFGFNFEQINNLGVSIEAKKCCLNEVKDYIYTWPGYKYKEISGSASPVQLYNKNANVVIHLEAHGLFPGIIATENGKNYGDSYSFELVYDELANECKLLSMHVFNWIVPKEIYDNAVLLTLEHPVVKDLIGNTKNYRIAFYDWLDDYKGRAANAGKVIDTIEFKRPVRGVLQFYVEREDYHSLWVYVDVFNGEIFAEGPSYKPPQ